MTAPAAARTVRPLDGLRLSSGGPPAPGTELVAEHLRLLGVRADRPADGGVILGGAGFEDITAQHRWDESSGLTDEATVQAATGVMAVHGRRDGAPRGLAVDYCATAGAVLTVQGLLAGLLAQARGSRIGQVSTSAERAGLLAVSQYLAAAGAEEGEASELAPGGPPFASAEGTLFELETLDSGGWAAFWRALDAPEEAIRRGWRPFQFRYATACAPFPQVLHDRARAASWERIRRAAEVSGTDVCRVRTLAERAAEDDGAPPWTLALGEVAYTPKPVVGQLLDGFTVLEAGRRVQAPLAAHLLRLLGAEVIRVEPPGGDPLRGMPPASSGISARWLALNRGKTAVEIDIKSAADRRRLLDMAAGADVFLHNWAPGKAAQLGLDHVDFAAANPGLVYAYTGGWADRIAGAPMGTDFMVQARTGVGAAVRPSGEPPAPSLMTLLDVLGGLLGTEAVLAGLLLRERTGRGVRVDSSLLGASDTLTAAALRQAAAGLDPRRPAGFRRPLPTADGWAAPADADAAAAAAYDLRELSTDDAVATLSAHGLAATAVTTDLAALPRDSRLSGSISRDAHGALTVPDPWSFR